MELFSVEECVGGILEHFPYTFSLLSYLSDDFLDMPSLYEMMINDDSLLTETEIFRTFIMLEQNGFLFADNQDSGTILLTDIGVNLLNMMEFWFEIEDLQEEDMVLMPESESVL